ncbi:hypothetical protein [Micromonospora sp. URMC 103]|uniref:hypothetical protein n=1 Tax=Micromonospora sp. URMC 103 TaxID=3423406 RepID=UPI003F1CCC3E
MDPRAARIDTLRILGTVAVLAGLATSLLTAAADTSRAEPYLVAALLVLTGVGLRIEAAVRER